MSEQDWSLRAITYGFLRPENEKAVRLGREMVAAREVLITNWIMEAPALRPNPFAGKIERQMDWSQGYAAAMVDITQAIIEGRHLLPARPLQEIPLTTTT